jgi:hypothetical protein
VDKTYITEGSNPDIPSRIAKVRIREDRAPNIGDKFASRCGQKGTVGLIIPEQDMPFTPDGIRPDLIVNPHAFPSRMTIGQFVETVMAKACVIYGAFGDCTAFVNLGNKHETFGNMLLKENYSSKGTQILYNGTTGEQIESEIFIGPTYYMRLKHMVKDKINFRARGPNTNLTRQPVQGRANDGGLRIGEMERDGIIGHGAAHFLQESMLIRGDIYYMAICNKTGMTAIYNPDNDVFMSPMADGPIKFNDVTTDNPKLVNITRFGRSFSIVQIPYSFKLLIQELQTMNCVMRVITEDNINQIESMSFSNNYKLLSGEKNSDDASSSMNGGGKKQNVSNIYDDGVQLLIQSDDKSDANEEAQVVQLQEGGDGNENVFVNTGVDANTGDAYEQGGGRAQPQPMTQNIVMNCNANPRQNHDINLEATSTENMGKEWIEMIEPESNKKYYYNEKTKDTMWYDPNPSKDYEYRPPNGWYTVTIGGHDYYHNPQKNLTKMREDVTPADANPVNEDENTTHHDDNANSTPSILMVQKTDDENANNEDDSSSSSGPGTKKIII